MKQSGGALGLYFYAAFNYIYNNFRFVKASSIKAEGEKKFAESPKWERNVAATAKKVQRKAREYRMETGGGVKGSGTCKLKNNFPVLIKN